MESKSYYIIKYKGVRQIVLAHSKWEAIDRFYNANIDKYPSMERNLITATKTR